MAPLGRAKKRRAGELGSLCTTPSAPRDEERMKAAPLALLFYVAFVQVAQAQRAVYSFISGRQLKVYIESSERERQSVQDIANTGKLHGYVEGVVEMQDQVSLCMPPVQSDQLVAIVAKYITSTPERWHLPAHLLVVEALKPTFGCSR